MKAGIIAAAWLLAGSASAQHHAGQDREKQYLEGAGMGYARAAELNHTGRGIAFVLPIDKVVGVAHFMRPESKE